MVSIDTRLRREIQLRLQEREAINAQRDALLDTENDRALQRVRGLIRDDLLNLWYRFKDNQHGTRDQVARWLRTKTVDDTYLDLEAEGKSMRTREHIQLMLDYLLGDKALFLSMYAEGLNRAFPIKGPYEWAPILVAGETESGRPVLTVKYRWHRVRPIERKAEDYLLELVEI